MSTRSSDIEHLVLTAWVCQDCDVEGRSASRDVQCWNCGGPVVVTARPSVPAHELQN
ncbi:MAG: hypothetical protein ACRDPK_19470 [Carbonactinosporaceae bacterium]